MTTRWWWGIGAVALGALVVCAMPSLWRAMDRAREAEAEYVVKLILVAERQYFDRHAMFTDNPANLDLLSPPIPRHAGRQGPTVPWMRDWGRRAVSAGATVQGVVAQGLATDPAGITVLLDGAARKTANGFGGHHHAGHTVIGALISSGEGTITINRPHPPGAARVTYRYHPHGK